MSSKPPMEVLRHTMHGLICSFLKISLVPFPHEVRHPTWHKAFSSIVCFLLIHSGHQVRWTYRPGSQRRKVAQNFSSTFFSAVRALIFLARRIQPFLSLVDREVEFCVLMI